MIVKQWITERTVINRVGNMIIQQGEYIVAETHEQAVALCPDGWTVSEWWVVSEEDYPTMG